MTKSDREVRDALAKKYQEERWANGSFAEQEEPYIQGWQSALEHSPRVTNAINALKEISYDAIRVYGSQEKAEASHPFCWKLVFDALAEFRKGSEDV